MNGTEAVDQGLYERLLRQLALAMDEVETDLRLRRKAPTDVELKGLSSAEVALVQAYLDNDLSWLCGWHAAAAEVARRRGQRMGASEAEPSAPLRRIEPALRCALCGAAVRRRGATNLCCVACGSRLFRSGKRQ